MLWVASSTPSTGNKFFCNSFVNNSLQVSFQGSETSGNSWTNSSQGNYWNDYNGTDNTGDGIGDTPYVIDDNNQDNHPLMESVTIPESPSLIILPILVAVSVDVKIYRKKQNAKLDSLF